jgi:Haem-NO-binding
MKGTILNCAKELVEKQSGKAAWDKALASAGCTGLIVIAGADVPDEKAMKIIGAIPQATGLPMPKVMEAFGDYWANEYADKMYTAYFAEAKTAMEFLLGMDALHTSVTRSVPNAHPPKFTFENRTDKSFVMVCHSTRGLADLVPGLVKGVARRYKTSCSVTKVGANRFQVQF